MLSAVKSNTMIQIYLFFFCSHFITRRHVNKLVVENCFTVGETLFYCLKSTYTK